MIEFVCSKGHRTEKLLTFAEAEGLNNIICPSCTIELRRRRAHRVISAPAIQFKGEGWTPTFHKPAESQIGGVPVHAGDDPVNVAKQVVQKNRGLVKAVKGAQ
jgi:predicted nucleic acid-binding Zn ribbon protein